MKFSDNLIRVISDAYKTSTKAEFLIRTKIMFCEDNEIIIKAIEVADLLTKLTEKITTDAEKRFYEKKISVEQYNKEIAKERELNPGSATIKEFIIGLGLVHSDSLEYMYNNLTKYSSDKFNIEPFRKDLDRTHTELTKILKIKEEIASELNITEIQQELTSLNDKAEELYKKINVVKTGTEETNKSINKLKSTLASSILDIQIEALAKQDITTIDEDIKKLQKEMNESINNKIKYAIEDQMKNLTDTVVKAITEKLTDTSKESLQTKTTEFVADKIETVLSTLETDIKTKITNSKTSPKAKSTIDNITEKVQDSIAKANNLEEDPRLKKIVDGLKDLTGTLDDVEISRGAVYDLMEGDMLTLSSMLGVPLDELLEVPED